MKENRRRLCEERKGGNKRERLRIEKCCEGIIGEVREGEGKYKMATEEVREMDKRGKKSERSGWGNERGMKTRERRKEGMETKREKEGMETRAEKEGMETKREKEGMETKVEKEERKKARWE